MQFQFSLQRRTRQHISSFISLLTFFFFLPTVLLPVQAAVRINEIFPKPSDEITEWIELYNNGPDSVSLEGWKLETSTGDKKTYTITGVTIPSNGYTLFLQSQTGLNLSNGGDTIRLLEANNNQADSQSYASTLGYNTSMGRSVNGAGVWANCTDPATPNAANNCPPPPNTPTPIPTEKPTSTPKPTETPTSQPTPTPNAITLPTSVPEVFPTYAPPDVLGVAASPTPSKTTTLLQFVQTNMYTLLWMFGIFIGVFIALMIFSAGLYNKFKHRLQ